VVGERGFEPPTSSTRTKSEPSLTYDVFAVKISERWCLRFGPAGTGDAVYGL